MNKLLSARSVSIVFVIILAIALSIGMSSWLVAEAKWQQQTEDVILDMGYEVDSGRDNGSQKYLIYAPLDSDGSIISSDYDTSSDNFTFTSTSPAIASVAVIGYTGTIAEVYVPDVVTINSTSYSVTAVLAETHFASEGFKNRYDIQELYFPASVTRIGAGVCSNMRDLRLVESLSTTSLSIGTYCFQACSALTSVTTSSATLSLGTYCFLDCSALTTFSSVATVNFVQNYAFLRTPLYLTA